MGKIEFCRLIDPASGQAGQGFIIQFMGKVTNYINTSIELIVKLYFVVVCTCKLYSKFQWRCAPALYILYRLALMIYADFWLIYTAAGFVDFGFQSGQKNDSKSQDNNISTLENGTIFIPYAWPVYLTNWTYLLLSLYLTVHALVAIWYLVRSPLLMFKPLQPHHHRQLFQELNTTPSLWENSYDIIMDSKDSVANTRSSVVPWYFKLTWVCNINFLVSVYASFCKFCTVMYVSLPQRC